MDYLTSPYLVLANSIKVETISTPIKLRFSADKPVDWVVEGFLFGDIDEDWVAIIEEDGQTKGYITFDDNEALTEPMNVPAGERATPITAEILLSASTTILSLPKLFTKHYFYFVLSENRITHVVSFMDMDNLPSKLSLFSLLMELEAKIIDLLMLHGNKTYFVDTLSPGRYKKACDLCFQKYGEKYGCEKILKCTTFADKRELLGNVTNVVEILGFASKKVFERFFSTSERVRNQIAHSDSIFLVLDSPEKLSDFVSQLLKVVDCINQEVLTLRQRKREDE